MSPHTSLYYVVCVSPLYYSLLILEDLNIIRRTLDSSLFPGLDSSIKVHTGFADAHEKYVLPFQLLFPQRRISGSIEPLQASWPQ